MDWLLFLMIGAFAGLLAGLFGVGGGVVIVPILILMFAQQGVDAALLVHLAIGTSFAAIVVTSCGSVTAHHRLGNVNWSVVKAMTPGLVVGVSLGSVVATELAGSHLQLAIAVFLMLVAVQMFFAIQPQALFGALAYAIKGLNVSGLPSLATGYIYWPAFIGIAIASIPFTRMGAMLAERVADKILKRSFALLLFVIGLQLLLTH